MAERTAQLADHRRSPAGRSGGISDLQGRGASVGAGRRHARRGGPDRGRRSVGRVEAGSSDDEIAKLGLTLNRMLDRLENESRRQQLFAAAASHELRSPLSTIRTELEVGLAYPDRAEWTKVAEDSLIEVARLEDLTRDLRMLTRSRSMRASVDRPSSCRSRRRRGRTSPTRAAIRYSSLRPPIAADPDAVVRVVRNLFDNAERHAAGEIRVAVRLTRGMVLTVANDGRRSRRRI